MEAKNADNHHFVRILATVLIVLFLLSMAWLTYENYRAGASEPEAPPLWTWIVNGLLLAIPVGLLYTSIGVVAASLRQHSAQGALDPRLAKLVYWSPRTAGIVIILFVSLFALDVFEEGRPAAEIAIGLFMHLLPSIAMTIVLVLAWRWPWVGFVAFLGAALFFLRLLIHNPLRDLGSVLLFSGPLLLIALLFGLNWRWREELKTT